MMIYVTRQAIVRPYRPEDRAALYDICVRTAHPPYAQLEPELVFVLDDGERAVGYILGTADTPAFVRNYRESWLPTLLGYGRVLMHTFLRTLRRMRVDAVHLTL